MRFFAHFRYIMKKFLSGPSATNLLRFDDQRIHSAVYPTGRYHANDAVATEVGSHCRPRFQRSNATSGAGMKGIADAVNQQNALGVGRGADSGRPKSP